MKVRATKLGYYNHRRQYPGDAFHLRKSEDFSKEWMEKLDSEKKPSQKKKVVKEDDAADLNQDVI